MQAQRTTNRIALVTCLLLAGIGASVAAQEPELIVEVETREIYEGESVLYRVTLNHVENPTAPILDGFDDFQVTSLGEQSLDSRKIVIINGQRSESVRRGRRYDFRLTPRRSGTLTIPAPTAKVGDEILTGREIRLRVRKPDDQDSVILEFTSDQSAVYPMQPFELALTIAVKELPEEVNDRDPMSVLRTPPALEVSWLSDDRLPDGLEPAKGWRQILEPLISRRGHGFQINNIGTSSVFSLFEERKAGFHPPPKRTTRQDANGDEAGYWEYEFKRTLIPHKVGTFAFEPITLKGTFADSINRGRLEGRRIYAIAPGLEIKVKDVPLDGRPDSYIGAVGSFKVEAELVPTTARIGDPMTFTMTLTGQGTLDDARPPTIATLPGIDGVFRTYDATEESHGNSRRFTFSLRPQSKEVTEFPAIPVSFFDVDVEQYVTITTDPIPITIGDTEILADSDIVSAPSGPSSNTGQLQVSEGGVFANDSNLGSLRNEAVRPGRWVTGWAAMALSWLAASWGIGRAIR